MTQEEVVNKILRDLKMMELISRYIDGEFKGEFKSGEAILYLNALFVAGWEQRRLEINQHGNKPIEQYDDQGKLIRTYKSLKEAAKLSHISEKGIYKSMIRKTPMKQGWVWKYLIPPNPDLPS